ncbi:7-deoxyloganetin glucosyltransferase isoform X1 [Manihot esculenta]|uniref:Glycosyltransferase N-terminal domain-containing protein n=1 Tax=Manihot esculenta TaxID=3983 RepID=A0A2C9V537_MANES|nr:7-deoxyloganetin glucosyltransferase isoform X1 [Manihot esculenta]OAY39570.1 hypothetical protein MANES_10G105200v8 [Manihot esculenta]
MGLKADHKPHAVCIPFPAQGHINPMLQIAKILHFKGFHITFVNTEFIHKRLKLNSIANSSINGFSNFRFETIPDGIQPASDEDGGAEAPHQDMPSLFHSILNNFSTPFCDLIHKLNDSSCSGVPPVTCIVADGGLTFTLDVARRFGIPIGIFWAASACATLAYTQYHQLIERGLAPLKDESYLTNGYLETSIDWIPGLKNIRLKDLPPFFRTTDPSDPFLNWVLTEVEKASTASALILNTFDSLEQDALQALCAMYPHLYTIGPFQLLVDQIDDDDELKLMGSSLWKEHSECLAWLDSKQPNSVLFVNFGSTATMTLDELTELAWGLANSKKQFLWVIRADLVKGGSEILPPEFAEEIMDRGFLTSWCPQEQVLKHPSVGGFLSHMGWNSSLESVCGGVPLICWPFIADQMTNSRYACTEWGVGLELEKVERNEVEKLVKELFEGEKGKEMKKKVMEWKRKAEEATVSGGSSCKNLDKLLEILVGNNDNNN